ncbi:MAG: hypothetical protein OXR68_04080 [Alphaproteobacteria bacterium]|nr:hypothetical protein [Alphaproteobacteria bacterium]MDD9919785.1 hypothetical protein [Alphaproteobacteria bacterium]
MSSVALSINGKILKGWSDVNVTRSMQTISGSFSLSTVDSKLFETFTPHISNGDKCQVSVDGTPVITGYVDQIDAFYTANDHTLTVSGRDKTGDLVDCSVIHSSGEFKNRTVKQIAQTLCQPFGITVKTDYDGKAFKVFRIEPGETVFDAIERMCRQLALLPISTPEGDLLLTRVSTTPSGASLKTGGNIKSASLAYTHKDRFSNYTVKGQQPGNDSVFGKAAATPMGKAQDADIKRHRPFLLLAEQPGDGLTFTDRAQWEANVRRGRSKAIRYVVPGWKHTGGKVWKENTIVSIQDDVLGVRERWTIADVVFALNDQSGHTTNLTVMPPESFKLLPIPEATQDEGIF